MSDPEATAPPVPPQKWKRILVWIVALVQSHPDLSAAFLLVVAAFFLGRCTA